MGAPLSIVGCHAVTGDRQCIQREVKDGVVAIRGIYPDVIARSSRLRSSQHRPTLVCLSWCSLHFCSLRRSIMGSNHPSTTLRLTLNPPCSSLMTSYPNNISASTCSTFPTHSFSISIRFASLHGRCWLNILMASNLTPLSGCCVRKVCRGLWGHEYLIAISRSAKRMR